MVVLLLIKLKKFEYNIGKTLTVQKYDYDSKIIDLNFILSLKSYDRY